jgi:hypothetical protein
MVISNVGKKNFFTDPVSIRFMFGPYSTNNSFSKHWECYSVTQYKTYLSSLIFLPFIGDCVEIL